jgi:MFS family permease
MLLLLPLLSLLLLQVLRLLLGLFEAGALPGMWALLAHFYSKERITMPLGWLMGALIVSQALGAPIAALLMMLDGHGGLRGWQWLFLLEGVAAVIVSASFFFMPKDIDVMKGLTPEEREALHASFAHHARPARSTRQLLLGALKNPAVWIAGTGIKFLRDVAFYGELRASARYYTPLNKWNGLLRFCVAFQVPSPPCRCMQAASCRQ